MNNGEFIGRKSLFRAPDLSRANRPNRKIPDEVRRLYDRISEIDMLANKYKSELGEALRALSDANNALYAMAEKNKALSDELEEIKNGQEKAKRKTRQKKSSESQ